MKRYLLLIALAIACCGCGMVQSIVKSSLPYTSTLSIPASDMINADQSVTGTATSLDQSFARSGNNARKVDGVHIVSATVQAVNPTNFNLGNLSFIKIYLSKPGDNVELPVASKMNIHENNGNNLVLDVDNSHFLDELVRQKNIHVRLVYQLRNGLSTPAELKVTLGLTAYPSK